MRILKVLLPCVICMPLSTTAGAEIYQSKDAQGNAVFSDKPSQGAEAVKVPPTNSEHPETDDDYLYYGDNNIDDEADDRTEREKRRDSDAAA